MKISPAARGCAAFVAFSLLLALFALLLLVLLPSAGSKAAGAGETEAVRDADSPYPIVVLDPGHGSPDGGCSGADGTEEKDLNLAIARQLCTMLRAADIPCVLTRTEDALLYDYFGDLTDYTGKKKVYDLKNRLRIAESYPNAILVSIHMNAFPDPQYKGLQVWYSGKNAASAELAETIQRMTREYLQPDNDRRVKRAGSSIYLLDKIRTPAVLIECGFLSNAEECAALKSDKYRGELSAVLFCALVGFLNRYMSGG